MEEPYKIYVFNTISYKILLMSCQCTKGWFHSCQKMLCHKYNGQRKHMYLIQHDMVIKWSIYLGNLY
jgi:hypothetical protein